MITERELIEHCSLTLSSLKTASLFAVKVESEYSLNYDILFWNAKFSKTGVKLRLIKIGKKSALVYMYRHDMLTSDLSDPRASEILSKYGYEGLGVDLAINRLSQRLSTYEEFPHEIGLFLGYPPEDVEGFICNKGKNCLLCRYWKVYGNENEALLRFAKYDKCKAAYKKLWKEGRDIILLTVKRRTMTSASNL